MDLSSAGRKKKFGLFDTHNDFRLEGMLIFKMRAERGDVIVFVAIRAGKIGSHLFLHLEIVDAQPIYNNQKKRRLQHIKNAKRSNLYRSWTKSKKTQSSEIQTRSEKKQEEEEEPKWELWWCWSEYWRFAAARREVQRSESMEINRRRKMRLIDPFLFLSFSPFFLLIFPTPPSPPPPPPRFPWFFQLFFDSVISPFFSFHCLDIDPTKFRGRRQQGWERERERVVWGGYVNITYMWPWP